ncbi:MAG: hypothetical protein N2316_03330 [Spirochaetes bacterium]|nr:hypothetical protein [Spirochaetota bacterium]
MNMRSLVIVFVCTFTLIPLASELTAQSDPDEFLLKYLNAVREHKPIPPPKEQMYTKNDLVYCTGNLEIAKLNNIAADMITFGEHEAAKKLFEKGLTHAPIFFPYLYNIGVCCLFLREFKQALIYLQKAKNILPEYSRTYLQIGFTYQMMAKEELAIACFREALKVNLYEIESLILIGDIYYNRNQITQAEKYYKASLEMDPFFPNGIIGLAKIQFYRKEYASTIITLKGVDTSREYDKALHYYYAESAYKLMDYKTAYEQYKKLLEFKNDKFFITHARSLIQHKLNLAERFIAQ